MTTTMQERVTFQTVQVRDLETDGKLTRLSGIAVPYNTMTDIGPFFESFERGAFGKSINESARALPLMLGHPQAGTTIPIGAAESWSDDVDGLRGLWRFTDAEPSQEAARAVRDGVLNFLSVRFMPNPQRIRVAPVRMRGEDGRQWEKEHLTHVEARLLEVGLVPSPAYVGASVDWVRAAGSQTPTVKPTRRSLDEWRDELAKLR